MTRCKTTPHFPKTSLKAGKSWVGRLSLPLAFTTCGKDQWVHSRSWEQTLPGIFNSVRTSFVLYIFRRSNRCCPKGPWWYYRFSKFPYGNSNNFNKHMFIFKFRIHLCVCIYMLWSHNAVKYTYVYLNVQICMYVYFAITFWGLLHVSNNHTISKICLHKTIICERRD